MKREAIRRYIDSDAILRYLNYRGGDISADILVSIERAINWLLANGEFKHTCQTHRIDVAENVILLDSDIVLQSKDLAYVLKGCSRCHICLCTLGHKVSQHIKKKMLIDPADGVILDATASAVVEAYAEYINSQYQKTTMRYSPGYGDLALDLQPLLFDLLAGTKQTGVYLTSTHLMLPEKSILYLSGEQKEVIHGGL